jgi:4-amino-4-deoxy-L-arabinose transferase-like glycosyltransferase
MNPPGPVNAPRVMPHESAADERRAGAGAERRTVRRDLLLLCLVGVALFFWRLGSHDLWPSDEPRFANVAREMRARGDYAVLSLNDRLYTDKPPLFFWAINGFGLLCGGVNEWSARLPSATAGLLTLFIIYILGRELYDRRVGLLGALVFATSAEIAIRARWASIDMTLNMFVLAAIALLWGAGERDRAGAERAATWMRRTAWALMGLATLAKGPVGLVLPLLAIVPAALLERDLRQVRRIFPPTGILLYVLVTLSWFGVFAHRLGLETALRVLVHQNLDRYVDAPNAQHPVWYLLWQFPAGFLPWSLFLPWGIAAALADAGPAARRRARFLLAWIAAILIFFSFSTGKRGVYIIPLYPAAALLVARLFAPGWSDDPAALRRPRAPLLLWLAASALLAAALPVLIGRRNPDLRGAAAGVGLLLLLGSLAGVLARRAGRPLRAGTSIAASIGISLILVLETIVPWVNRYENLRGFGAQISTAVPAAAPLGAVRPKRNLWVFYVGRFIEPLDTNDAVRAFLSEAGPRYALVDDDTLRAIRPSLPPGVVEILSGKVAEDTFSVLRGGPPPSDRRAGAAPAGAGP